MALDNSLIKNQKSCVKRVHLETDNGLYDQDKLFNNMSQTLSINSNHKKATCEVVKSHDNKIGYFTPYFWASILLLEIIIITLKNIR